MIEKVEQALKTVKTAFPYFKTVLYGFRILHHGKAFLKCHSNKYQLNTYLKQQEKNKKNLQQQYNRHILQKKLILVFNQERLLLKTALILRKRYF